MRDLGRDSDIVLNNSNGVVDGELSDFLDHAHDGTGIHAEVKLVGDHAAVLLDGWKIQDGQDADVVDIAAVAGVVVPDGSPEKYDQEI